MESAQGENTKNKNLKTEGAAFFMKKGPLSSPDADMLWNSFSRTGKIGVYLTYRAIKKREEKDTI